MCWLWSLIIYLIHTSFFSSVFILDEYYTPLHEGGLQGGIYPHEEGLQGGIYPPVGSGGIIPLDGGSGGEALEGKLAL
jgi:hypothetical protein